MGTLYLKPCKVSPEVLEVTQGTANRIGLVLRKGVVEISVGEQLKEA